MATTPTEHRTAKATEKLADSAETLVGSAQTQEDSADRRTTLAATRTLYAAERTYAAWMRTGLAALAAGVGAQSLLDGLVAGWMALAATVVLLVFAAFCFGAGIWREVTGNAPRPDPDTPRLPAAVMVAINAFMVLLTAMVLVGIASR